MGSSRKQKIDVVVYVDPHEYYSYAYAKKSDIARAIGEINRYFENQNKNILLVTPGRIGTSSPELGVPVVYAEISHFSAIMDFVRFSFRMLLTEIKVKSTQRRIYFVL